MPEYRIKLTLEAIYDVTDIADYIEAEFGKGRADRFQTDIGNAMEKLGRIGTAFPETQIIYRNYAIHKYPFSPSIIFYIIADTTGEIHVLRVLREERNWKNVLKSQHTYTYPE